MSTGKLAYFEEVKRDEFRQGGCAMAELNLTDINHKELTMDIDSIFPSKYLKADELPKKKTTLTIKSVQVEDIGEDTKPVLIFREASKGLVLNKTKSMILKEAFGNDTDHWTGKQIDLYPTRVSFQSKMVAAIGLEPVYPLETLPLADAAVDLEFNDELPDFMK